MFYAITSQPARAIACRIFFFFAAIIRALMLMLRFAPFIVLIFRWLRLS